MLYDPRPPGRTPAETGTVLETTVVSIAATVLFVAATIVALAAAALAGDDPATAAAIAAVVWIGALVVGVLGARRLGMAIGRRRRRWHRRRQRASV